QNDVIDRRTLAKDFRVLVPLLRPGMRVLDGGPGNGAITIGMAEAVGPSGHVVGVEHNPHFVERARQLYAGQPNLEFRLQPLEQIQDVEGYDVVTSARTLQWMPAAGEALRRMVRATKPGGLVVVLDYNHTKIRWEPEPPASMRRFMDAWLTWRAGEGMDNKIADQLAAMFETNGLTEIRVVPQHEPVRKPEPAFQPAARIWANMRDAHGAALVAKGLCTQEQLGQAKAEFEEWIDGPGRFQEMYLLACIGRKPPAG
ncbi:MAG TPA: methyltransferase domain-containing protein, partial [Chloroflexota bacterium]|nr:methyltransferase domain-containing protein [Chloroflexota bacterium]